MTDYPAIEAKGLVKRFGDRVAVDGLDLSVAQGQFVGLLGPNGAGKTTTLQMVLGRTQPTAGTLSVLGEAMPGARRSVLRRVGLVPQLDNLDPDFTVAENLYVYASFFGQSRQTVDGRIRELLEIVSLEERADAPISSLSGGMKRRLSIARALVNEPQLLILDEPTTGLDPQVRHLIWGRLRELNRQGKTLVLTTHYMEEAERLCDVLMVMDEGRVVAAGAPRELIAQNVESDVLEIRDDQEALSGFLNALVKEVSGVRHEIVDRTHYLYCNEPRGLFERLAAASGITYLHRPANLEDVFLRVTGRDLRE